jgi:hypothetical protein
MVVRLSPSGKLILPSTLAGELRWPTIVDTTSSGAQLAWIPVNTATGAVLGATTVGVRVSPAGGVPLVLFGMALADDQEISVRVGRASSQPVVIVPESSLVTDTTMRFATPNGQTLTLRKGETVVLRKTEGRVNVQTVGQALVQTLTKATGTTAVTAVATELSVAGAMSFAANTLQVGMCFQFEGYFEFIHTAAALPLLGLGFSINAAALSSFGSMTPASVAATFSGQVEGYARVASIGAGGQWRTNLQWKNPSGLAIADQIGGATFLQNVDTTVASTLDLKMFMQTGVASNTLSLFNGFGALLG